MSYAQPYAPILLTFGREALRDTPTIPTTAQTVTVINDIMEVDGETPVTTKTSRTEERALS